MIGLLKNPILGGFAVGLIATIGYIVWEPCVRSIKQYKHSEFLLATVGMLLGGSVIYVAGIRMADPTMSRIIQYVLGILIGIYTISAILYALIVKFSKDFHEDRAAPNETPSRNKR